MRKQILVETALMGAGTPGIAPGELRDLWSAGTGDASGALLVWRADGTDRRGGMEEFLAFRNTGTWSRIRAGSSRRPENGYYTAGALLEMGRATELVVTAGIGGMIGENISGDLPAICRAESSLVCAGFKDMVDAEGSLNYLRERGIPVCGLWQNTYNGFLFRRPTVRLNGEFRPAGDGTIGEQTMPRVLFVPVPVSERLEAAHWLDLGFQEAKAAAAAGKDFHPEFNRSLERMSQGKSSILQIMSLIRNIEVADSMVRDREEGRDERCEGRNDPDSTGGSNQKREGL